MNGAWCLIVAVLLVVQAAPGQEPGAKAEGTGDRGQGTGAGSQEPELVKDKTPEKTPPSKSEKSPAAKTPKKEPSAKAPAPAAAPEEEQSLVQQAAQQAAHLAGPIIRLDTRTLILLGTVLGLLIAAFFVGRAMRRSPESSSNPAIVRTFNNRVAAWWLMFTVLTLSLLTGIYSVTVTLFGLVSFWALREYITMTPTRRGDHRTLFWTFFILLPGHYILVALGSTYSWAYGVYTILIPVYASLFIPARVAISGDPKRFLERVAKIQAGLLICVYALSHAPALLSLVLTHSDGQRWFISTNPLKPGSNAGLLFYFILLTQLNDVFGYFWGQLFGRHVIAPQINASKTWEGFAGGLLCTMLIGMALCGVTPFRLWEAPFMAMAVSVAGFAGGMTMSAIKRDRGVSDYGTLVSGHAGVLDRIDSICFAA
ncbi:MAG TPA: phosphatidate cytidylyltransferase, partial [Pirellulaceae bacterium]|nr:phosphatidate cytidylyltransferase [Pirellulaceae bacterium]